jgi:hypothetical protein
MTKKKAPRPVTTATMATIHARVLVFAPMSEVGELFALAAERGWKTHSAMPFIDDGGTYVAVASKPNAI